MGKSAPKPPPAPDYAAAATAQGAANLTAANQGAVLSNPNIISPYGNQTVTWGQADPNLPGGGQQATVTQSLTPAAQAALEAQQRVQLSEANLADQGINKAAGLLGSGFQYNGPAMRTSLYGGQSGGGGGAPPQNAAYYSPSSAPQGAPFDGRVQANATMDAKGAKRDASGYAPSNFGAGPGAPDNPIAGNGTMQTGPGGVPLDAGGFPTKTPGGGGGGLASANNGMGQPMGQAGPQGGGGGGQSGPGAVDFGPRADTYGLAGGIAGDKYGMAQGKADLSGVAAMPVNAGMTGQNAILSRLQPQIDQTQKATAQRLANQGIPVGSEAWNNEMRQQGQDFNDLYSQAALKGIGLDMSANEQGFNQAQQNAGLFNTALAQNFGQGLQGQQLTNSAIGQNFGQGATAAGLYNQAQNQQFNQNLQQFSAENAAQQADWGQQLAQYNQPLNQVTALMSGSQIQNPQFQAYSGQNVQAAPVFQGAQAQGQYAMDAYGQQVAAQNAKTQALGSVLGAGASFIPGYGKSDLRLKSNIVRTGTHPWGVGIYEYDIEDRRERGVIAQEVMAVRPEAVARHPDGYLMVDYDQLLAA